MRRRGRSVRAGFGVKRYRRLADGAGEGSRAVSGNARPTIRNASRVLKRVILSIVRAPARSLSSKIVSFVFLTALVASLAVTWVSAQSIRTFLREKTDQRIPIVLGSVNEHLQLWYDQRELDVRTFASSSILRTNVDQAAGRERSFVEAEQFLTYVLKRFDQYRTLFVLDADSTEPLVWAGEELDLPDTVRSELRSIVDAQISAAFGLNGVRYQVVSAPIVDDSNRQLASLNSVIDLAVARAELRHDGLSRRGALYAVSDEGIVLMQTGSARSRASYSRPAPLRGTLPAVEVYELADGQSVIGSSVRFDRFNWTIAVEEPAAQLFGPAVEIVRKVVVVNVGIVLLCSAIAFQITRSVVRPIQGLSEAAVRVADGEPDVVFPENGNDEIGVLGRAFNEMIEHLGRNQIELENNRVQIEEANQKLVSRNQELQRINEVFHQLSITDELTKLHNHRFFQDHLPREMSRATRTGEPLCLILIDIDDFKRLNDEHGHSVGDAVLKKTADVMNGVVREMDLLARYGGEEFALLASQATLDGATALAEKLRMAVSQARFPVVTLEGISELSITVSIGVAAFDGDQKALFNDADRALYRAKDQGKDCVVAEAPRNAGLS